MASNRNIPDSSNRSRPMQAQSLFDDCIQHPHLAQICTHTRSAVSDCYCIMLLLNPDSLIDLMSMLVLIDTGHI